MTLAPWGMAAEIVLQQGHANYAGCKTGTVVQLTRPGDEPDDGVFRLRGSRNSLQLRFEIPEFEGVLARARLMVFLPAARTANRFTEIFCHEVFTGGRQPSFDEATDYDNGRRRGAVDSVELFAPAHEGWPRFPFLPLGIPEGGRWIEFNITPLAEKWIRDKTSNHGVLLIPTDPPDLRLPSTWEIDVPTATSAAVSQRPKLVLETVEPAAGQDHVLIGITDSLRRICDRSTRFQYRGPYTASYRMSMAANEHEGFQVVLYPLVQDLTDVRLSFTDLRSSGGETIPASDIHWFLEDSYMLRRNWMTSELLFAGKLYETTDPLLPGEPADIRRQVHTPLYVSVRTRPDTSAGVYRGKIGVWAEGTRKIRDLDLEVAVWPYAVPDRWNFHAMGQFIWSNVERFHKGDAGEALFRRYYDFLIEHRFAPTEQYLRVLSPRMDLAGCLERGVNTVYLNGNFSGTAEEMAQLGRDYETVRKLGALDYGLVYIGDETDKWDEMRRRADLIHAHFPGVQVMIGGSFPREDLLGYIDVYDPQIDGRSKIYSLQPEDVHLIRESQERGEEFYWYVAAGPPYPHPNVHVENPLIASRVLFWMTWKYGVTGFEYYCYNIWERNYAESPDGRYPRTRWKADGWSQGWPTNGDGMLFYPGPISSLRFEAIRDGIEDWESHMVLRDYAAALRDSGTAAGSSDLVREAERMLEVSREVVAGFDQYTFDPGRLLSEREALGNLIARLARAVPVSTFEKARQARIARQTDLRRKMLRERHIQACTRLKLSPVSEEAWNALWKP